MIGNSATVPSTYLQPGDDRVVRRFGILLRDMGIQSSIMLEAGMVYGRLTEALAEVIANAIRDLTNSTDNFRRVENIANAAPSLQIVATLVRSIPGVNPDCVPSAELIGRCLKVFYEKVMDGADEA